MKNYVDLRQSAILIVRHVRAAKKFELAVVQWYLTLIQTYVTQMLIDIKFSSLLIRVDIVYYINILDDTLKTDPNSGFFCTLNGI